MNKFAFDIGGTYIKSAVITEENQLLDYDKVKTPINENEAILNVVEQRLKQYIERYRTSKVLVGISTAGAVNRETASIAYANPNIKPESHKIYHLIQNYFFSLGYNKPQ